MGAAPSRARDRKQATRRVQLLFQACHLGDRTLVRRLLQLDGSGGGFRLLQPGVLQALRQGDLQPPPPSPPASSLGDDSVQTSESMAAITTLTTAATTAAVASQQRQAAIQEYRRLLVNASGVPPQLWRQPRLQLDSKTGKVRRIREGTASGKTQGRRDSPPEVRQPQQPPQPASSESPPPLPIGFPVPHESWTPLMVAAHAGHAQVCAELLEAGADVRRSAELGLTALMIAAHLGYASVVEELLSFHPKRVPPSTEEDFKSSPGSARGWGGNPSQPQPLACAPGASESPSLASPSSTGFRGGHGTSPPQQHCPLPNVDQLDDIGETALLKAAKSGHQLVAAQLLAHGADVNRSDFNAGMTPLLWAAEVGPASFVTLLLEARADVNCRNHLRQTPLISAASKDFNYRRFLGITPPAELGTAGLKYIPPLARHVSAPGSIVEALIKGGADINAKNHDGYTACMVACYRGHGNVVEQLVGGGADILAKAEKGQTALILASAKGQSWIAEYLVGQIVRMARLVEERLGIQDALLEMGLLASPCSASDASAASSFGGCGNNGHPPENNRLAMVSTGEMSALGDAMPLPPSAQPRQVSSHSHASHTSNYSLHQGHLLPMLRTPSASLGLHQLMPTASSSASSFSSSAAGPIPLLQRSYSSAVASVASWLPTLPRIPLDTLTPTAVHWLNARDEKGETALHKAVQLDHGYVVGVLVDFSLRPLASVYEARRKQVVQAVQVFATPAPHPELGGMPLRPHPHNPHLLNHPPSHLSQPPHHLWNSLASTSSGAPSGSTSGSAAGPMPALVGDGGGGVGSAALIDPADLPPVRLPPSQREFHPRQLVGVRGWDLLLAKDNGNGNTALMWACAGSKDHIVDVLLRGRSRPWGPRSTHGGDEAGQGHSSSGSLVALSGPGKLHCSPHHHGPAFLPPAWEPPEASTTLARMLNGFNHIGQSPLTLAARHSSVFAVECLLNTELRRQARQRLLEARRRPPVGSVPESKDGSTGGVGRGNDILGDDWSAVSSAGATAADWDASGSELPDAEGLRLLELESAELGIRETNRGNTAMHLAAELGRVAILECLLEHRAQIDVRNHDGQTPLVRAILNVHSPAVTLLVSRGANCEIRDTLLNMNALDYVKNFPQLREAMERGQQILRETVNAANAVNPVSGQVTMATTEALVLPAVKRFPPSNGSGSPEDSQLLLSFDDSPASHTTAGLAAAPQDGHASTSASSVASSSSVLDWTVEQVGEWLQRLRLGQYADAFAEAAVDGEMLLQLLESQPRSSILETELGMQSQLHRMKVVREISKLRQCVAGAGSRQLSVSVESELAQVSPSDHPNGNNSGSPHHSPNSMGVGAQVPPSRVPDSSGRAGEQQLQPSATPSAASQQPQQPPESPSPLEDKIARMFGRTVVPSPPPSSLSPQEAPPPSSDATSVGAVPADAPGSPALVLPVPAVVLPLPPVMSKGGKQASAADDGSNTSSNRGIHAPALSPPQQLQGQAGDTPSSPDNGSPAHSSGSNSTGGALLLRGLQRMIPWREIRLLRPIGRGQFGTVFLSQWRGAWVAVKRFHRGISLSQRQQQDFQQEARLLELLNQHPNVIRFCGVSIEETSHGRSGDPVGGGRHSPESSASSSTAYICLVTQFLPLGSLEQLLIRPDVEEMADGAESSLSHLLEQLGHSGHSPSAPPSSASSSAAAEHASPATGHQAAVNLDSVTRGWRRARAQARERLTGSMAEIARILKETACGMVHLHCEKVIHRDLAARNLLVDNNLAVVITDFGMSRIKQHSQGVGQTNSVVGPLKWMSPEAIRLQQYSEKSDVYSFGICVWEILARQTPYPELPDIQAAMRVASTPASGIPFRPTIPADCPEPLAAVMRDCWHPEPARRPSFEQLVPRLQHFEDQMRLRESSRGGGGTSGMMYGSTADALQLHQQGLSPVPASVSAANPAQGAVDAAADEPLPPLSPVRKWSRDSFPGAEAGWSPVTSGFPPSSVSVAGSPGAGAGGGSAELQQLAELGSDFALLAEHEAQVEASLARRVVSGGGKSACGGASRGNGGGGGFDTAAGDGQQRQQPLVPATGGGGIRDSPNNIHSHSHDGHNNRSAPGVRGAVQGSARNPSVPSWGHLAASPAHGRGMSTPYDTPVAPEQLEAMLLGQQQMSTTATAGITTDEL